MNDSNDKLLAVLIDADNISYKHIRDMLIEITRYGTPTLKRIYGDWTRSEMTGWKSSLLEYALTPVQQYGYTSGKNSTDSAMIIDAMDILYTGTVDGFCIVSSDSDFTRLAIRLREAGKVVYGIGEKKTPVPFISACSKFIYIEILGQSESEGESTAQPHTTVKEQEQDKASSSQTQLKSPVAPVSNELKNLLKSSVSDLSDDDGWTNLAALGTSISKKQPDFDSRNYGFQRLSSMLKSLNLFEFDERTVGNSKIKHIYLRNKQEAAKTTVKRKQRQK
ncbi:NYN domain-containing protein [Candidatus Nomurabacteria bacterium]|nr:NYN domain-containing protein [Candidatus Nomurabacteria bacterium]